MSRQRDPLIDRRLRSHPLPQLQANPHLERLPIHRHEDINNHNLLNGPKRPSIDPLNNKIRSPSQKDKKQEETRLRRIDEPRIVVHKAKKIARVNKKTTVTLQTQINLGRIKNLDGHPRRSPSPDRAYPFHLCHLAWGLESD